MNSGKQVRRFGFGFFGLCFLAPASSAQLLFQRAFESDLRPSLTSPLSRRSLWDLPEGVSFWAGFNDGLVTRANGQVRDLYQERIIGFGATGKVGDRFRYSIKAANGDAGGRSGGSSPSSGGLTEDDVDLYGSWRLSRFLDLDVGFTSSNLDFSLYSLFLGSALDTLGKNPPIRANEQQKSIPLFLRWRSNARWELEAGVATETGDGDISTGGDDGSKTLRIPIRPEGLRFSGRATYTKGRDSVSVLAGAENATGHDGLLAPGTSSGSSRYSQTVQNFGLSFHRDWGRRGSVAVHYENVASQESFSAFDPDAADLSASLPRGSAASASGSLTSRRCEAGVEWKSPSRMWDVSYRQVAAPFSLSGGYGARYLIFSVGQSGAIDYRTVDLGIVGVAYSTRISRATLTLGLQQIVPFSLQTANRSNGSSTVIHPQSSSTGGTSISLLVSFWAN